MLKRNYYVAIKVKSNVRLLFILQVVFVATANYICFHLFISMVKSNYVKINLFFHHSYSKQLYVVLEIDS